MAHSTSCYWIRFGLDPSTIDPVSIAKEAATRVVFESRGNKGSFGLNLRSPLPQTFNTHKFAEIIKIYVYEASQHMLFAKSVRLSHSAKQIFIDLVKSEPDRSRNYFERKITEVVAIQHPIVQAATNFSVSVNTGVVHLNSYWFLPESFEPSAENITLFQLLCVIFTHEKVFPVWSNNNSFYVSVFDSIAGSTFFAKLYEHYLLM